MDEILPKQTQMSLTENTAINIEISIKIDCKYIIFRNEIYFLRSPLRMTSSWNLPVLFGGTASFGMSCLHTFGTFFRRSHHLEAWDILSIWIYITEIVIGCQHTQTQFILSVRGGSLTTRSQKMFFCVSVFVFRLECILFFCK